MPGVLFPELPGLEWDLSKKPIFNTKIMQSVNGRELRASYQAVPKYEISLSFGFLRESKGRNELQQLEGFFIERRGAFDSFLFKMPEDCEFSCTYTGDGVTTSYALYKKMNTLNMPISHTQAVTKPVNPNMWNRNEAKNLWASNSEKLMWNNDAVIIESNGKATLSAPLEDGVDAVIDGVYYYKCRFADDEQQYTNFMSKLWKANKVDMVGSLGNKV